MRVDNHIHLRHIMLYHFEKGWSAAESFRDLKELFGQGTIGRATVYEWFDRFKSGNTSVDDEPGRGRPSEFDDKALLEAVEEDESLTTARGIDRLPSKWQSVIDVGAGRGSVIYRAEYEREYSRRSLNHCSNHGKYIFRTSGCKCDEGWTGDICSLQLSEMKIVYCQEDRDCFINYRCKRLPKMPLHCVENTDNYKSWEV
ncbi:unnamed protein product, partial [Mesorhabditis belari]|uniref:EGF-like domain-containing protein n=1 Tax=Mesorhabditis belari TaxID=2138241 RepID=A0AAF3F7S3_9BILA